MSASLDITNNSDQVLTLHAAGGLSIPRGSTAQRPTTYIPSGTIRFNTTTNRLEIYYNNIWNNSPDMSDNLAVFVTMDGGIIHSDLDANNFNIKNLAYPIDSTDAVNVQYVTDQIDALSGTIDAGTLNGYEASDFARSNITISGAQGLTGSGPLSADVTIRMGTPSAITSNSFNVAINNTHSHQLILTSQDIIDYLGFTPLNAADTIPPTRQIIAGQGMNNSSGGTLDNDVTLDLGMPSSITLASNNTVGPTTHSHQLVLTSADIISILGYTPMDENNLPPATGVPASRNVNTGVGLEGGGSLANDIQIRMKTPQAVSITTGNTVDGNGHTHQMILTKDDIFSIIGVVPTVYTGTTWNYTDYPIGHQLIAIDLTNESLNNIYLNTILSVFVSASMYNAGVMSLGSNMPGYTKLPGTWVTRGKILVSTGGTTKASFLMQKIAMD